VPASHTFAAATLRKPHISTAASVWHTARAGAARRLVSARGCVRVGAGTTAGWPCPAAQVRVRFLAPPNRPASPGGGWAAPGGAPPCSRSPVVAAGATGSPGIYDQDLTGSRACGAPRVAMRPGVVLSFSLE
jgi:hypothetical protein